jgi:hypothetical protein
MTEPERLEEEQPRRRGKPPYFLQPAKGGGVTVFHRPCGNRAVPKDCGTMPNRSLALALVRQLQRAESAVGDLFLEATDDGIEALEAVIQACQKAVLNGRVRGGSHQGEQRASNRPRRPRRRPRH